MSAQHCPACGKHWSYHGSIAATCVRLQAALKERDDMTTKYHNTLAQNEKLRVENFRLREAARIQDERLGNGG